MVRLKFKQLKANYYGSLGLNPTMVRLKSFIVEWAIFLPFCLNPTMVRLKLDYRVIDTVHGRGSQSHYGSIKI